MREFLVVEITRDVSLSIQQAILVESGQDVSGERTVRYNLTGRQSQ